MYFKYVLLCVLFDWNYARGEEHGKSSMKPESRIVGGQNASLTYAYQVSMDVPTTVFNGIPYGWHHLCGGSIISERHILTAGSLLNSKLEAPIK